MHKEELQRNEYLEPDDRRHIRRTASSGNSASLLDRRITRMKQPKLSMACMFAHPSGQMSHGVISASAQGGFWIIVSAESAGGVAKKTITKVLRRGENGGAFFLIFFNFFGFAHAAPMLRMIQQMES